MSLSYAVPATPVVVEYEIKKSRFITHAFYVEDREQAMQALDEVKQAFPDARHHCWAYLIGDPAMPRTVAMSDDGEPSGTAGKPILNVLQHKEVGDILLVVVRYFGGIKLGAGGLVRAYSQAAQQAMDAITTERRRILEPHRVRGDYALEQGLRHWLSVHGGEVREVEYSNDVVFAIVIDPATQEDLQQWLAANNATLLSQISEQHSE